MRVYKSEWDFAEIRVKIPRRLHCRFKARCLMEQMPMSALVISMFAAYANGEILAHKPDYMDMFGKMPSVYDTGNIDDIRIKLTDASYRQLNPMPLSEENDL